MPDKSNFAVSTTLIVRSHGSGLTCSDTATYERSTIVEHGSNPQKRRRLAKTRRGLGELDRCDGARTSHRGAEWCLLSADSDLADGAVAAEVWRAFDAAVEHAKAVLSRLRDKRRLVRGIPMRRRRLGVGVGVVFAT
jgi:hypothetical protein